MRGNIYQALPAVEVDKLVRSAVARNLAAYPTSFAHRVEFEDHCQIAHAKLLQSIYDAERGKPSTFIYQCVNTEMAHTARSMKYRAIVEVQEMEEFAAAGELDSWSLRDLPLRADLMDYLHQHFVLGRTQREIAAELGTTRNKIRTVERDALRAAGRALQYG